MADKKISEYDVCILGGGPAGLTAGIYAGRYGLKSIVVTREIGGKLNYIANVENYPGFMGSGIELVRKLKEQVEKFSEILNSNIKAIEKEKDFFIVRTEKKDLIAKSLIIALGTEKKKLGIKNEEKFLGRGVSYCATCDANFFRNKKVAVIGGGDSAAKTALLLSGLAEKVYLVYYGESLKCSVSYQEKLKKNGLKIFCGYKPKEIKGKDVVSALVLENTEKKEIKVDGIFIEIGYVPAIEIAKRLGVKLDEKGYIIVDSEMKTNVRGVFAAGDIVKGRLKQIVTSASQGAIAAKSAYDYISEK